MIQEVEASRLAFRAAPLVLYRGGFTPASSTRVGSLRLRFAS
jgi:hypothetical protein